MLKHIIFLIFCKGQYYCKVVFFFYQPRSTFQPREWLRVCPLGVQKNSPETEKPKSKNNIPDLCLMS